LAIHAHERFDREWVVSLLDRVGRGPEFLDQAGRELSGGEAQVVAVIRALQLHPRVLLLDEPTASLDAATAQAIEQLVAGWHREAAGERATVWVTHDHEQSSRVADRLLWMKSGHLVPGE
jgi:putative ABC transport system ATP-binding protein